MRIRQRKIEMPEQLKDALVNLNMRNVAAQTRPSAVAEDHIVRLGHTCQALFLSWVAFIEEPALGPEDVGVLAVQGAVVAVHGPG